jgi:hypothetical protein
MHGRREQASRSTPLVILYPEGGDKVAAVVLRGEGAVAGRNISR